MAAANNPPPAGIKVEIYKLVNHLKARMGIRYKEQKKGFIEPQMLAEADKLIADLCETSQQTITEHLEKLGSLWLKIRDMRDSQERTEISQQIFTLAHEIKDIGSLCGYELVAYFAESLRDYIGRTELNINAQVVIVQAHLDAMQVVNRQGIRAEAGPEAEELKKMVKIAIDKYS